MEWCGHRSPGGSWWKESEKLDKLSVFLESGVDDTIGLHGWDSNVGDPQADKEAGSDGLDGFGTAQLAAHSGVTPEQEGQNGDQRLNAENGHRESQAVKSAPLSK